MYIGIDTGKNGAIVELDPKGRINTQWVIPLKEVKSKKKSKKTPDKIIDLQALCDLLSGLRGAKVVIEETHAIFGVDKGTMFKMGRTLGNIESAIACHGYEYSLVPAKQWQKAIWIPKDIVLVPSTSGKSMVTDTKATSLNAAIRLFPDHDFRYGNNEKDGRKKIAHDGIIDAALIALYCKQLNSK